MIQSNSLVKEFGQFKAVDKVSFEVKKGEILGFLGPNGAGKSTTMKMITGYLSPTSGSASIGGFDIQKNPISAKKQLGYLPETGPLYPEMTVLEFLKFCAEMRGVDPKLTGKDLPRVIQSCQLTEVIHQTIETLSKGFRQRVGMAQAIIHEPAALIMDEPTDGLDPNQKLGVRKLIESMAKEKAIIISTHILEEVESMCTRVIIIDKGKILIDKTPRELIEKHPHYNAIEIDFKNKEQAEVAYSYLTQNSEIQAIQKKNQSLQLFPKNKKNFRSDILQLSREKQWELNDLRNMPAKLSDVFRSLTEKNAS